MSIDSTNLPPGAGSPAILFIAVKASGITVTVNEGYVLNGFTFSSQTAEGLADIAVTEPMTVAVNWLKITEITLTVDPASGSAARPNDVTVTAALTAKSSDNPATGDGGKLSLWLALLFVSGGTAVTLTVYGRKERSCANNPVMNCNPSGHLLQCLVAAAFAAVTTWLLYIWQSIIWE